jgi:hypothetical protein
MAALALAGLVACGEDAGSPTRPVPAPGVQSFGDLRPQEARYVEVPVTVAATLRAQVDWASSANDLDLYLTPSSCGELTALDLFTARCTVLARAVNGNIKPEVLNADVRPGSLRVWVVNFGPGAESGTLAVTLSPR